MSYLLYVLIADYIFDSRPTAALGAGMDLEFFITTAREALRGLHSF
jgi:hypothetical protein